MISNYLYGRLGNLMFEIAASYSLALDNNDEHGVDFINGHLIERVASYDTNPIFKKVNRIDIRKMQSVRYFETYFHYNPIPYTQYADKLFIIAGYFQSELYFLKNKDKVINMFSDLDIIDKLRTKNAKVLNKSVSLSVRRTDYVELADYHNLLGLDYYADSIKYIDSTRYIEHILVFSDDIKWCKENLHDERMIFVDDLKDYEALYLMSLCENNIVANSSFAWWGSYLNKNEDKIVIMPARWLGDAAQRDWRDIYPQNVIIMK